MSTPVFLKGDAIRLSHMASQLAALRLEAMGMRFSKGSVAAHVRREYNLSGRLPKLRRALAELYRAALVEHGFSPDEAATMAGKWVEDVG